MTAQRKKTTTGKGVATLQARHTQARLKPVGEPPRNTLRDIINADLGNLFDLALPPLAISQPLGINAVSIGIPNLPVLAGLTLYAQAIIVQPTRARFTNMTLDIIQ